MDKQSTLALYPQKIVQPSPLGLFGILKEAYKTSIRNGKPLLFITFIMLSCYSIMDLGEWFIMLPITQDLISHSELLPRGSLFDADPVLYRAMIEDVQHLLAYLFLSLCFWGLSFLFTVTASVHSTYEAYTAKVLSLKDMLSGSVRVMWKRAFKTSIWMIMISLVSVALLFFASIMVAIMKGGGRAAISSSNWILISLGGCYVVYLCSLWMLSLVVCVLEDDMSGFKAISEGNELMMGKKVQGFVLMVVMILAGIANSRLINYLANLKITENPTLSMVILLAVSLLLNLVYCVLKSFIFVVYTLLYYECKMSKTAEENRAPYAPISAAVKF